MTISPTVERVYDYSNELRQGKLDLRWIDANGAGWGARARARDERGLGVEDLNDLPHYGDAPDQGSAAAGREP